MDDFYLYLDNKVLGPYPESELRHMLAKGEIQRETLCNEGASGEWVRLEDCLALSTPALAEVLTVSDAHKASVACPFCKQNYEIDAMGYAGRDILCGTCQKLFRVPKDLEGKATAGGPAVDAEEEGITPAADPDKGTPSTLWAESAREIPNGDLLCPHCWKSFDSDNLLYIATHPSLVGDPILGEFVQKRFTPSVFNDIGQPLDERGLPATDTACPRCHLPYPQGMIDNPSCYFSIAGATSSGKSYFLTGLVHQMRRLLPQSFNAAFYDVNPRMNETICHYEELLFMAMDPDQVTALPATQLSGDGISNRVLLNGVEIELPQPFVFGFHPAGKNSHETNLVFYDNSGEMFIPGRDEWVNQATFHLSHSNGIVFLFDPTNDANMRRKLCDAADPQVSQRPRSVDQLVLLNELISRIRRHANLTNGETCRIPLVVAIGKYDTWRDHFERDLSKISPITLHNDTFNGQLDMDVVMDISYAARELMRNQMPEFVETAERFFQEAYFLPVSTFGTHAEMAPEGFVGVVPSKISPIWLEVPALVLMACNGLVQVAEPAREATSSAQHDFKAKWQGNQLVFLHPVTGEVVRLPANYGGHRITIGGKAYLLPRFPAVDSCEAEGNPWK